MQIGRAHAGIVEVPENRPALLAIRELVRVFAGEDVDAPLLFFLHGRPGMGKTRLASKLIDGIQKIAPHVAVSQLSASDLTASAAPELLQAAREADFLVLEDLQHLHPSFVEAIIDLLDQRDAEGRYTLVTATSGPKELCHRGVVFPARLRSRLAAGLVIALESLSIESRIAALVQWTQGLSIDREALAWLARQLSTWREIEGAVTQMTAQDEPLTPSVMRRRFEDVAAMRELTVERIAERVADYFDLSPRWLRSQLRQRGVLQARQISMYLARRLTKLPLERIGRYFGGRDHSTVLHACAKVEKVLATPSELAGTIRQLEAELT